MATTIVNNFISPRTPLEMVIKTDNLSTGSTANNQFSIPHYTTGLYNYLVDWGDGIIEEIRGNTSPTHTYSSIGTYSVKIWGVFAGLFFNFGGDRLKLLGVISKDKYNTFVGLYRTFWGCSNLSSMVLLNTSATTNFERAFASTGLGTIPPIDTSFFGFVQQINLITFPSISLNKGVFFWRMCRLCLVLTTFPPNLFDNWSAAPALDCFLDTWFFCISLTAQSVENILVSIDVSGQSAPVGATGTQADITIAYNTATGSLSTATNTAIANLKAKGWKPHINNVYV
jgi:hypothetical protein